jgi:hypothetical protein
MRLRCNPLTTPVLTDVPQGVADGHHLLADLQRVAVAKLQGRQRRRNVHLEQGQVLEGRGRDQPSRRLHLVMEDDVDQRGVLDDMLVGDDDSGRIDHDAGTDKHRYMLIGVVTRRGVFRTEDLDDRNVDNRRQCVGDDVGTVAEAGNHGGRRLRIHGRHGCDRRKEQGGGQRPGAAACSRRLAATGVNV